MDRVAHRWHRRQMESQVTAGVPHVQVTVSQQVIVAAEPDLLWRVVWDPATSVLVDDAVERAFTVPGTPAQQVGEQQCHVMRQADGTLVGVIHEVVELEPGHRAVTMSRSVPNPLVTTTVVLPLDGPGAVLRIRFETTVPANAAPTVRDAYASVAAQYLSRVRDLVEAQAAISAGQS